MDLENEQVEKPDFSADLLAAIQEEERGNQVETPVDDGNVNLPAEDSTVPAGQAEDQPGAASPPSPHAQLAQRLGLPEGQYKSEQEVYDAARGTFDHYRQAQSAAEQLRQQNAYYEAYIRQQQALAAQQQQQAPVQQKQESPWWSPPKYDPQLAAQYITVNDKGERVWAENTPADVKESTEAWAKYVQDWEKKVKTNPEEAFRPIREQAAAEAEQRIWAKLEQQRATQQVTDNLRNFAEHLVEKDAFGQVVRNPLTGEPVLNRYGQAFDHIDRTLQQSGVQDPVVRQNLVVNQLRSLVIQDMQQANRVAHQVPAQHAPVTPQPGDAEAKKLEALRRAQGATRLPNRGGAAPGNTEATPKKFIRFADLLKEEMHRTGAEYEPSNGYN